MIPIDKTAGFLREARRVSGELLSDCSEIRLYPNRLRLARR